MATMSCCLTSVRAQNASPLLHVRAPSMLSAQRLTAKGPLTELQRAKCKAYKVILTCKAELKSKEKRSPFPNIRPGGMVETDKLATSIRERTMKAIDSLGGRVTLGDVASSAGLNLAEAEKALQAFAADAGGFLEVSNEGDVLYVFPRDYKTKLATKSFRIKFEPLLDKSKAVVEYLIRVSFGTALVLSIVIVYTAIIAALVSGRSDDNNRNRQRSYNPGFRFYISPYDMLWYWNPNYSRGQKKTKEEGMNFFESVFSFVFGDGDPNEGIEEVRWKMIGEYITSHGGVVAAEELAPFLDTVPAEQDKDESYVLPVLLRYDGHPDVDDNGNIVYRFPSLQRTASSWFNRRKEYVGKKWKDWIGEAERLFQEKRWKFSKADQSGKLLALGLGGLNFAGVVVLGSMLKSVPIAQGGFLSFVADIYPLLQVYAASYFAIPIWRWFLIQKKNADIDKRNRIRKEKALALEEPDALLRQKLTTAREMAERTVIGSDRIVYSTDRDINEQDYDAKEWERKLRELER